MMKMKYTDILLASVAAVSYTHLDVYKRQPPVPMAADGTLTFTLTGDEDLLLSGEQNGSLSSPFTSDSKGTLIYNHLLTKLSFAIHLEGDDIPSLRVRSDVYKRQE